MKFTVQRSRWIRGADSFNNELSYVLNDACLLRPRDNKMCCLGFVCNQLGLSEDNLRDVGAPEELPLELVADGRVDLLVNEHGTHTQLARKAIAWNDDTAISDAERETALIRLFNNHGYDLEFVP